MKLTKLEVGVSLSVCCEECKGPLEYKGTIIEYDEITGKHVFNCESCNIDFIVSLIRDEIIIAKINYPENVEDLTDNMHRTSLDSLNKNVDMRTVDFEHIEVALAASEELDPFTEVRKKVSENLQSGKIGVVGSGISSSKLLMNYLVDLKSSEHGPITFIGEKNTDNQGLQNLIEAVKSNKPVNSDTWKKLIKDAVEGGSLEIDDTVLKARKELRKSLYNQDGRSTTDRQYSELKTDSAHYNMVIQGQSAELLRSSKNK